MYQNAFVLTGTIGSGKSTVANFLKLYGFHVIDADKIAHEILEKNTDKITEIFGKQILENGKISRQKLGNLVFKDKNKLEMLENFLHPKIRDEIYKNCELPEISGFPYFVDIPLFYEKNNYKNFKKVVVVYAKNEILKERIKKRNHLNDEEAKNRINLQMNIEKKRGMANFIIDNSGDLKHLESEILKFIKGLKNEYKNLKI